jgi:branched-chain amino acid transport system permease protein
MECGIFRTTYQADNAFRHTVLAKLRLWLVLLLLATFPLYADAYYLDTAIRIGYTIVAALGLNILVGYAGQISVGLGAFLGVGAYASALLTTRLGLPFWIAMPLAGLVTAGVGAVFGIPSLRLKGLYLAIATLAAQVIIEWTMYHWVSLTNGSQGISSIPIPRLGPISFASKTNYFYLTYTVVVLAVLFAANLFRTKMGRAFVAVRDRDIAAEVMGVNLFQTKLMAFAVSSFFIGVAGSLEAHYRTIINPEFFNIGVSIEFLAMIIIGGLGSLHGSIFGAIFITELPVLLRSLAGLVAPLFPGAANILAATREIIFGVVIILFLVIEPEGLARIWKDIKNYFKLWPFAY